jgi:hypothetical protein
VLEMVLLEPPILAVVVAVLEQEHPATAALDL